MHILDLKISSNPVLLGKVRQRGRSLRSTHSVESIEDTHSRGSTERERGVLVYRQKFTIPSQHTQVQNFVTADLTSF